MDVNVFYQKVRQIEERIAEPYAVVVSLETADGGKAGIFNEAPTRTAARLVVEGRARLATGEEAAKFRAEVAEAKRVADQLAAAGRMQVTVVSEADLRALKSIVKKQ